MKIKIRINELPEIHKIIEIYRNSRLKRPIEDFDRIQKMYKNSNLVVSAWDNDKLVGVARALTDFSYCCYVSDLAVDINYQKHGIGKLILDKIKLEVTNQSNIVLISAPEAEHFYEKVGFEKLERGFIIKREK